MRYTTFDPHKRMQIVTPRIYTSKRYVKADWPMCWFGKSWKFTQGGVTSTVTELQLYRLYLSIADGRPLWQETFPNNSKTHRAKDFYMQDFLVARFLVEYTAGTWFITSPTPAIRSDILPVK